MISQDKIELREQAMQELLGDPPGWLIRWGITIFWGIIITLLIGCYFFKYPEIITAPIQITTEQPASWVIPKISGKIDSILVKNHSHVQKDEILAYLESSADFKDITMLTYILNEMSGFFISFELKDLPKFEPFIQVGELQDSYSLLLKSINEYTSFYEDNLHQAKIIGIQNELFQQKRYLDHVRKQVDFMEKHFDLTYRQYRRDSLLFSKKMMSDFDFEKSQQTYLVGNVEINQSKMLVRSTQINISKLEQSINEYNIDFNNRQSALQSNVFAAYDQLTSRLKMWEQTYLLKSPMSGIVNFSTVWSKNQNVSLAEKVFCVIPDNCGKIIGKANIPTNGAGKIKQGQTVIIKLEGYPYMEFGMLNGIVKSIVPISNEIITSQGPVKFLTVEVNFPKGFITTYHKKIPFKGELTGIAEISTKEMSLLEHLVRPLRYLWSKF